MYKKSAILACFLLSSCMVGPNYKDPKPIVAEHWVGKNKAVRETSKQNADWWKLFNDPNLTALVNQGYHNNLTVQSAGVRVLQMRAQLAQTVGSLYPQQQAMTGNYQYYRMGGNYLQDVLPSSFSTSSLGFTANWEADFWGKYRRAIRSNDAAFLASFAAYDQALVTLVSDIASTYVNLRTIQSLITVTNQNIAIQEMSLKLTLSRYNAGQISLQDVEQAKTELAETQSQLPGYVSLLQQQKDSLAVLLGLPPDKLNPLILEQYGIPKAPSKVAVGIPKEAIARRPDIHEARLNAIAQSEMIGATKASLLPALSLVGNFIFSANTINGGSLGQMFNASNINIIGGPALNWPLLNYGQITNSVRVKDAVFQQALLSYMNLVLQAQKEIQDNITRYIEAQKTEKLLAKASRSAAIATKLTIIRYREGEIDYTSVLYAQQQQLRIQSSLVKAQGEVPQALIALYRALGGGWQVRQCNDIVPKQMISEMGKRTNWGGLLKPENHLPPTTSKQQIKQLYLPNW